MLNVPTPARLRSILCTIPLIAILPPCFASVPPANPTPPSVTYKLQATCLPTQLQLIRGIKVNRKNDDAAILIVGNSQTEKPRSVPISRDLAVRANVLPGDKICVNTAAIDVDRRLP
jgi:hypothetical protein